MQHRVAASQQSACMVRFLANELCGDIEPRWCPHFPANGSAASFSHMAQLRFELLARRHFLVDDAQLNSSPKKRRLTGPIERPTATGEITWIQAPEGAYCSPAFSQ